MKVTLRYQPMPATERLFDRWRNLDRHLEEPVARIGGDALRRAFAENFSSEGHGEWANLASMTVEERRALGYAGEHPILVREGDLRESVTNPAHPLHVQEMQNYGGGRLSLSMGSEDPRYDRLHFGEEEDKLPARPMMVLWAQQEPAVEMALVWAVEQALGIR